MTGGWRKCDTCRKVRKTEEFDGGSTTCRDCLSAPVKKAPAAKASPVRTTRAATTEQRPAQPRLGSVGMGDLEVRERRARRAAYEQLAESHPEEFALLLAAARRAEGLRA